MKQITLIATLLTVILFTNAQVYDVIVHIDATKLGQGEDFVHSLAHEYAQGAANIPSIMKGQSPADSVHVGERTTILFSGNAQMEIPNDQYGCIEELRNKREQESKEFSSFMRLCEEERAKRQNDETLRLSQMTEQQIRKEKISTAVSLIYAAMAPFFR